MAENCHLAIPPSSTDHVIGRKNLIGRVAIF